MTILKFKPWIDDVERINDFETSRFGKLRLDKNERVTPFGNDFFNSIIKAISSEHLNAYPEPGLLYNKLSMHCNVGHENIVVTAGADGAIRHCFDLFVNPDDQVICLDPTFAMVEVYCRLYKAKRVAIKYRENLTLNFTKLENSINKKTSLIVIANPNSPTGTLINEKDLKKILHVAQLNKVAVLIDEAYFGFSDFTALPFLNEFDNLVVSRTFSKVFGLAGLRVGFLVANRQLADLLRKFKPMYEVNQLAIQIAIQALENYDLVQNYITEVKCGKNFFLTRSRELGFKSIDTHTNFVHVDLGDHYHEIRNCLKEENILVKGGLPVKGFEKFLRFSVGPKNSMERVIPIFESFKT